MKPKITIILPVHNVEPYLRQCLDSVINQTMPEIQIICVNDGSTDGSRAILQEYADKDSRIEIIDQENQGAGSARNAAYPYIKGKYTYFADPDDWLELDLCEKTHDLLEETEADAVFFKCNCIADSRCATRNHNASFHPDLPHIRCLPEEKYDLLQYFTAPWYKVWNSNFLLNNQCFFCEGKRPNNDMVQTWLGVVQAKKIAILDEKLYTYRLRPGAYQSNPQKHFVMPKVHDDIKHFLIKRGYYPLYKDFYVRNRLHAFAWRYDCLPGKLKQEFKKLILEDLADEEWDFIHSEEGKNELTMRAQLFYAMIEGDLTEALDYYDYTSISPKIKAIEQAIQWQRAEFHHSLDNLVLLQQKKLIYRHYYRCKILAQLTFGKKRKHYKEKRDLLHEKVRRIREMYKWK